MMSVIHAKETLPSSQHIPELFALFTLICARVENIMAGLPADGFFLETGTLKELIRTYENGRLSAILRMAQETGVNWCTRCFAEISLTQLHPVLLEGKRRMGTEGLGVADPEAAEATLTKFCELHRICPMCLEKARAFSEHYTGRGVGFWASEAREERGHLTVYRFGNPFPLPEGTMIKQYPAFVSPEMERRWGLPPYLGLCTSFMGSEIIFWRGRDVLRFAPARMH